MRDCELCNSKIDILYDDYALVTEKGESKYICLKCISNGIENKLVLALI